MAAFPRLRGRASPRPRAQGPLCPRGGGAGRNSAAGAKTERVPPRAPSDDAAGDLNVHLGEPAPTSSSADELQEVVPGHESVAASDAPARAPVASQEEPASHARTGAKPRDAGASRDLARPGEASARVLPRPGEGTVLDTEPGAPSSPAGEMNSDERVHLEDEQQHRGEEEHGAGGHEADDGGGANGR